MSPAARIVFAAVSLVRIAAPKVLPAQTAAAVEPGIRTERQIGPDEVHLYEIALLSGQFFRVEVEQNHLDAAIRILSFDGAVLREVDNAGDRAEPLSLSIVASRDEVVRVEIRLRSNASVAGTYALSVGLPRAATEEDLSRPPVVTGHAA